MTTEAVITPHTAPIHLAAYGKIGSKKTLQGGWLIDLAGADNVLVINADQGLATIESWLTVPGNLITVKSVDDIRAAYHRMAAMRPDQWIFIDGGTEIHEWIAQDEFGPVDEILTEMNKGLPRERVKPELRKWVRFVDDRLQPDTMRIYGQIGQVTKRLLSSWKALPCNLYVTYLEEMTQTNDRRQKCPPWGPKVPGRVGLDAIMSGFDYVMRFMYDTDGLMYAGADPSAFDYLARTRNDQHGGIRIPRVLRGRKDDDGKTTDFKLSEFITTITNLREARTANHATTNTA